MATFETQSYGYGAIDVWRATARPYCPQTRTQALFDYYGERWDSLPTIAKMTVTGAIVAGGTYLGGHAIAPLFSQSAPQTASVFAQASQLPVNPMGLGSAFAQASARPMLSLGSAGHVIDVASRQVEPVTTLVSSAIGLASAGTQLRTPDRPDRDQRTEQMDLFVETLRRMNPVDEVPAEEEAVDGEGMEVDEYRLIFFDPEKTPAEIKGQLATLHSQGVINDQEYRHFMTMVYEPSFEDLDRGQHPYGVSRYFIGEMSEADRKYKAGTYEYTALEKVHDTEMHAYHPQQVDLFDIEVQDDVIWEFAEELYMNEFEGKTFSDLEEVNSEEVKRGYFDKAQACVNAAADKQLAIHASSTLRTVMSKLGVSVPTIKGAYDTNNHGFRDSVLADENLTRLYALFRRYGEKDASALDEVDLYTLDFLERSFAEIPTAFVEEEFDDAMGSDVGDAGLNAELQDLIRDAQGFAPESSKRRAQTRTGANLRPQHMGTPSYKRGGRGPFRGAVGRDGTIHPI